MPLGVFRDTFAVPVLVGDQVPLSPDGALMPFGVLSWGPFVVPALVGDQVLTPSSSLLRIWFVSLALFCLYVICLFVCLFVVCFTLLFLCCVLWKVRGSVSIPSESALHHILVDWSTYKPTTRKKMVFYCNTVWPMYVLEFEEKWPLNGSLNYYTVFQLALFCQRSRKWDKAPTCKLLWYKLSLAPELHKLFQLEIRTIYMNVLKHIIWVLFIDSTLMGLDEQEETNTKVLAGQCASWGEDKLHSRPCYLSKILQAQWSKVCWDSPCKVKDKRLHLPPQKRQHNSWWACLGLEASWWLQNPKSLAWVWIRYQLYVQKLGKSGGLITFFSNSQWLSRACR